MENTVSRELRNIRICLIILIIVIAFWDREKTVEITDHGSDSNLNISNMTQVGDNTFAYKDESNQIKIFKFDPNTASTFALNSDGQEWAVASFARKENILIAKSVRLSRNSTIKERSRRYRLVSFRL